LKGGELFVDEGVVKLRDGMAVALAQPIPALVPPAATAAPEATMAVAPELSAPTPRTDEVHNQ
jgi:hypothetical protein